jgi:hypothetical protein
LNMIQSTENQRVSIKGMRKVMGWNNATLRNLLDQTFLMR